MAGKAGTHKHALSRHDCLYAWLCSFKQLTSAPCDYAGIRVFWLCVTAQTRGNFLAIRWRERERGIKEVHKEILKEGCLFGGGGVLRQSPSQARASWPVEAVNRQGSLVFCAWAARLIGKTVYHTGCCSLSMVNRQWAQTFALLWILLLNTNNNFTQYLLQGRRGYLWLHFHRDGLMLCQTLP